MKNNFFRKNLVFAIIMVFVVTALIPVTNARLDEKIGDNGELTTNDTNFSYTHTVLGEYGTITTCPHCPPVSDYLSTIYSYENYDFYYVSLVANKNTKASQRCSELGISGVPDVHFDGGYDHVLGNQGSTTPYMDAISDCGSRTNVQDIDLDVTAAWIEAEQLTITASIQNNECCGGGIYNGHLRVYVTEIVSRWNDQSGHPYHFGMLDYAFNEDITVVTGSPQHLTTIWDGAEQGYDIVPDNIMIIAAVYSSKNNYVDEVAASTILSGLPDTTITSGPDGTIAYTDVTFEWTGTDENTPTEELLYSYKLEPYELEWSEWTSNTTVAYHNLADGEYAFMVKAKNTAGEDPTPDSRSFTIDQTPAGYTNITVEETWDMLNCSCDGRQIPIDVRTLEEFIGERIDSPSPKEFPRLFPYRLRNGGPGPIQQEGLLLRLFMWHYKNSQIILYCRTGHRSSEAAQILIENGFTGVIYNMVGGITAWKEAWLPTVSGLLPSYGSNFE